MSDLGTYTIDELDAIAPGRVDLLGGAQPDAAAGVRSLMARGMVHVQQNDVDLDALGTAHVVADQTLAVAAVLLQDPQRSIVFRRDDIFGSEDYAVFGQTIDDQHCYVIEGGTSGVRRLVFATSEDVTDVIWSITSLDEIGDVTSADDSVAVVVDVARDLDDDSPLARTLATPSHVVTAAVSVGGGPATQFSFVRGDSGAWICEWTSDTTMSVVPLDRNSLAATMARILA